MQLMSETQALPLSWSPVSPYESDMLTHIKEWLESNPSTPTDSDEIVVQRAIFDRINNNRLNPALMAYPAEVQYATIWAGIVRGYDLMEDSDEFRRWQKTLDIVWGELVAMFSIHFTKPPRTDSE